MRNYTKFFDALTQFNQEKRNSGKGKSYETLSTSINEYTDLTNLKDNFDYTTTSSSKANPYSVNLLTADRINKMNALYDKIHATGAKVYMSFAPINRDNCTDVSKKETTHAAFVKKIDDNLHVTVIVNFRSGCKVHTNNQCGQHKHDCQKRSD